MSTPEHAGDLAGKVAVVTGAVGGIGLASVAALAEAGARVVMADVPSSPLAEATRALADKGHQVAHHEVDIRDEASVEALIDFAVDTFGGIDVLDNNAALTSRTGEDLHTLLMDVELWDDMMAVNVRGPMLMCKHAIPVMIERGGGSVINIASGQALAGDMMTVAYGTSKGAVVSFTRFVAAAYGHLGIRCNTVAPGLIRTPTMEAALPTEMQDMFAAHCLLPRLGEPREVAELVTFLASERSSYITGQTLQVDGGILSHLPTLAAIRTAMA